MTTNEILAELRGLYAMTTPHQPMHRMRIAELYQRLEQSLTQEVMVDRDKQMKSILKSELIAQLNKHRENDIYVEFENYEIPVTGVYYDSLSDQLRIKLDPQEVKSVRMLIKEKSIRENIGK